MQEGQPWPLHVSPSLRPARWLFMAARRKHVRLASRRSVTTRIWIFGAWVRMRARPFQRPRAGIFIVIVRTLSRGAGIRACDRRSEGEREAVATSLTLSTRLDTALSAIHLNLRSRTCSIVQHRLSHIVAVVVNISGSISTQQSIV